MIQVSTLVLKPSQMAIICLSFAKYAVEPFVSECEPPHALVKLVAVIAIGKQNSRKQSIICKCDHVISNFNN